jgi:hypothetical protein
MNLLVMLCLSLKHSQKRECDLQSWW